MKNILSKTKTAIILLIVTVLLLGSYVYIIASPVTYGMKYRNETVYEGQAFVGALKYSPDGKVISENTNFDEPLEMYYYSIIACCYDCVLHLWSCDRIF